MESGERKFPAVLVKQAGKTKLLPMLLAVGSNRLATKLKAYETPTWLKITRLTPASGSNFDTDYSVEVTQEPKIAAPKA